MPTLNPSQNETLCHPDTLTLSLCLYTRRADVLGNITMLYTAPVCRIRSHIPMLSELSYLYDLALSLSREHSVALFVGDTPTFLFPKGISHALA